jgi:hypothetical protein
VLVAVTRGDGRTREARSRLLTFTEARAVVESNLRNGRRARMKRDEHELARLRAIEALGGQPQQDRRGKLRPRRPLRNQRQQELFE